MGLDMYLNAKRYVSNYSEADAELRGELDKLEPLAGMPINEIVCEAMYWRKANAIHDWFVKNVQNGEDDCGTYYVENEQLQALVDTCKAILADHTLAAELLPTASGFFFGSTDYDDYYYEE